MRFFTYGKFDKFSEVYYIFSKLSLAKGSRNFIKFLKLKQNFKTSQKALWGIKFSTRFYKLPEVFEKFIKCLKFLEGFLKFLVALTDFKKAFWSLKKISLTFWNLCKTI